jgi:hypothetical protein
MHIWVLLSSNPADDDYKAIDKIIADLREEWASAQPCGDDAKDDSDLTMSGSAWIESGIMFRGMSTHFLGLENNGGGGPRRLNLVGPDENAVYVGAGIELHAKFGPSWDIFVGGFRARSDHNSLALDPLDGTGERLLLPGVGEGPNPSGFFQDNEIAGELIYRGQYRFNKYHIGVGKRISLGHVSLRPTVGFEFTEFNFNESLKGQLQTLNRYFFYDTRIQNEVKTPFVGLEARFRPHECPIEYFLAARYGFSFNHADGTDSLMVEGFDRGQTMLWKKFETNDIQAKYGFTINPDGRISATIQGRWERIENLPRITRPGTEPSKLNLEESDTFTGGVSLSVSF